MELITQVTPRPPAVPFPTTAPRAPRSLPEFRLYQPRDGHPDWSRLAGEARELARSIGPTLDRPASFARLWRRRLAAQRTVVENFWLNRHRALRGREDLLPLYFIWTVHRACNFRCTYCDDHLGRRYPELPKQGTLTTEQGRDLLRIMRTRTPSVYFAGGEPTIRPDLPELTRAARDLDYFPLTVNTNAAALGRQLRKARWRSWLADMDIIVVSLDRLDLNACQDLWGYKRPEEVMRNLLLLRELSEEMRFKLMVNTVIQPGQIDHARDVLNLANDLGITFCPVPLNVGPRIHPDLPGDPEFRAFGELVLERKRQGHRVVGSMRLIRRLMGAEKLRCRNTLKPHIDYDGHLYWPCKSCQNVSPERVNVLDFSTVDALYCHACALVDPTRFHGPATNQCGADCNWAQNYTTDAYAHGLENPLSLLRDVVAFAFR